MALDKRQGRTPTKKEIRLRAFQLHVEHGGRHGHDVDDWLQAEYELMQLPVEEIAKIAPPKSKPDVAATPSLVNTVHQALHQDPATPVDPQTAS